MGPGLTRGDPRRFRHRLGLALLPALAAGVTFIAFGIVDIYLSNRGDFGFWFGALVRPTLLLAGGVTLGLTLVTVVWRGKAFDLVLSAGTGLLLAGWLQGLALNPALGEVTGATPAWNADPGAALGNAAVWLGLVAAVAALRVIGRRLWEGAVALIAATLLITSVASGVTALSSASGLDDRPSDYYVSTRGLYSASSGHNVVFVILDMLDQTLIEQIAAEDPHFFDPLNGFTEFDDNLSLYNSTFPSEVNMLTGAEFGFDRPVADFFADAWADGRLIPALRDLGYSTNLYATHEYAYNSVDEVVGLFDNVITDELTVNAQPMMEGLLRLAGVRYLPLALKPFVWPAADAFEGVVQAQHGEPAYTFGDKKYYDALLAYGISVTTDQPRFSYLHLNGSHPPWVLTEDLEKVGENQSTVLAQTKAAFKIMFAYLDQLRALGLYDDATVIITGDHGVQIGPGISGQPLHEPKRVGLFVKRSGATGPLAYSHAAVSTANLAATIIAEAGGDPAAFGVTYFDVPQDQASIDATVRPYFWRIGSPGPAVTEQWQVTGDAADWANWTKVGEEPWSCTVFWQGDSGKVNC